MSSSWLTSIKSILNWFQMRALVVGQPHASWACQSQFCGGSAWWLCHTGWRGQWVTATAIWIEPNTTMIVPNYSLTTASQPINWTLFKIIPSNATALHLLQIHAVIECNKHHTKKAANLLCEIQNTCSRNMSNPSPSLSSSHTTWPIRKLVYVWQQWCWQRLLANL